MEEKNYNWINFYMEFADKLLEYKDNQEELISKIVKTYDKIGMEMATLDRDENERSIIPNEIDPFTVFALFNKQITWENRVKIIKGIKEEFSILSEVPQEFPGIPVLNNLRATFFLFSSVRGKDDIPNLWNVFESAMKLSKDDSSENRQNFIRYYEKAINQWGIKWNLSMALYWIRPYYFINLDEKNRSFLTNPDIFSDEINNEAEKLKNPPNGEDYLKLCALCKDYLEKTGFENFAELSAAAYANKYVTEKPNNGMGDNDIDTLHYWVYAPGENASKWDELYNDGVMSIGWDIGDLKNYANRKEMNIKLQEIYNDNSNHVNITKALDDMANKIQKGDIIFVKKGRNEIIGKGIVESDYEYDHTKDYPHIRKVKWINVGNWNYDSEYFDRGLPLKTLTDLSDYKGVIDKLNLLIGYDEDEPEETSQYPEYSIKKFLKEVYIDEKDYFTLVNLLKNKKNLIIQGAPGVGKTFMAKRLAYSIIGEKNMSRVMMVQFHQSYSYEDFIMGFRPTKDGFELKNGTFYTFCKKAEIDNENKYFFIIDEINRGNLSKIFGELFMLIESDKRGEDNKIQLLYSDELFCIPENVYIIGLMNTADRSLAMIDYALRRRFAFFDLKPGFQSRGFKEYQEKINDSQFDDLIKVIEQLNEDIKNDDSLGEGFRIGHSFFCDLSPDDLEEKMKFIVEYEIIPLIKEYWFDEEDKINEWSDKLREVVN